jgi:hypothetical protein
MVDSWDDYEDQQADITHKMLTHLDAAAQNSYTKKETILLSPETTT